VLNVKVETIDENGHAEIAEIAEVEFFSVSSA
jgi:hypothetical protein